MAVRKAMFAGSWYPADAADCERQIRYFLKEKPLSAPKETVGAIVPHAGWTFSGGIACRAISLLQQPPRPETVVIFGMHMAPRHQPCIMTGDEIDTPFGPLAVDTRLTEALTREFSFEIETARVFSPDNTIELQLPFIKYFFPEAAIVPVGIPPAPAAEAIGRFTAEAAVRLEIPINVLGSTDLTHYGPNFGLTPYGTGPEAHERVRQEDDRRIIDQMLAMEPGEVIKEALNRHNACCAGAAAAALAAGKAMGAQEARLTEYATSYDKSPGDSFVGYTGIVF